MGKDNYISYTINGIKEVLEKNEYRRKRYNKDMEWFQERKKIFTGDIIRVAIMGITSSGKSTLVNTLLCEKILPMAIRPSSSIIITASKGEKRQAIIYFKDRNPEIIEGNNLNEETIKEYADENRNSNNKLNVTQIDITTPDFLLNENIHIIDSPGLDAWELESHEKLTLEILLPTIDICIFLTTVKANSDEVNAEKIKIVNEKEKQIILVQNMIDSIEEKLGKNGIVEEDKSIILKKHKRRAENLLREGTNNNGFEVIQISALNGLKGIINKDDELYKNSNIKGFIGAVESCTNNIFPSLNKQRAGSFIERINDIINTDKEIISGNDIERIDALRNVRTGDINELAENFQNAQEKILGKIKEIEEVILNTINEISNSTSEEFESYLNIVEKINNKNLYIESDILDIVKECEKKKNEVYQKLNLDTRHSYSLPNMESNNIYVKHKYEEKTMLFKKEGVLNRGKRLLSNIFDKEWGYKEVEYDEKVVDKEATIEIANDVCNQNMMHYLNILKEWSIQYNKSINIFYDEASKRTEEYEEKKNQKIEIYDIEDVNKNLTRIKEELKNLSFDIKKELKVATHLQELSELYSISKIQYNLYKLGNEVLERNYLIVGNYIKEINRKKLNNEAVEIFWTWDIEACHQFASRAFGINLNEDELETIKREGVYFVNNSIIVYELCKDKLNFYTIIKKIKQKPYIIFIIFNGIQIANSKKQILESLVLNYFIKDNHNLIINLVIDSCKVFVNANNVGELLVEVNNLKVSVTNKFDEVKYGYVLINSKNPIYNMALIESQEKDKFIISDYRDIKEKLFGNPLSRGSEEKETLEEILSYFLNREMVKNRV
ncbi:bacterial dynamin-like protein [Clostridium puniceum]|uniref:Bacterial dynamin-like protein n=1 Tax=Clostridium puniceum TaxID=29367 RepID=A0A1S8SZR8_9CLOT|nr:dynamin family protein [Clostridium puniceum]OOM70871.1 bacterial dynamin-like protein [Clostridium puniceum]